ncbi:YebG family protein [Flocculibacter collagenilyticus]|uniref:YebG family protein n=1 Tax=Flocculibacter collagenilyticus TaxID=2744479 RepID=UPI0018F5B08D|nr:YebG family protein [Flocculibacter collagenilyticus]
MAVETRYVIIRTVNNKGKEVMTFTDKKSADEYDRMLDMAEHLTVLLDEAPLALDEAMKEELSVFLAKNREDVLIALQAKKKAAEKSSKKADTKSNKSTEATSSDEDADTKNVLQADITTLPDTDTANADTELEKNNDFIIEKEDAA